MLADRRGPGSTAGCGCGTARRSLCAPPPRNSTRYQGFLQFLEDVNPEGQIIVVTDSLSSHHSKSTRMWLQDHPRIRQVFIPVGACWFNLQEGLGRRVLRHPDEISHATRIAIAQLNTHPALDLGTATAQTPHPPPPLHVLPLRNKALEGEDQRVTVRGWLLITAHRPLPIRPTALRTTHCRPGQT